MLFSIAALTVFMCYVSQSASWFVKFAVRIRPLRQRRLSRVERFWNDRSTTLQTQIFLSSISCDYTSPKYTWLSIYLVYYHPKSAAIYIWSIFIFQLMHGQVRIVPNRYHYNAVFLLSIYKNSLYERSKFINTINHISGLKIPQN